MTDLPGSLFLLIGGSYLMRSTVWTCLMLLSITGVYFVSCQSTEEDTQLNDIEQSSLDDLSSDSALDSSTDSADGYGLTAPHPKEPTAWFTRKLLMTSRQPSSESISKCKDRVESTAGQATNLRALEDTAAGLEAAVNNNPRVYHWCFYQMMSDLDINLAKDAPVMEEKAGIFIARMRSLWALGKALDSANQTNLYMRYLKSRYTEISQNVFGRNLEPMDARDFRLPASDRGKSAAAFDE
jgi:hypothetical protein